MCRRAQIFSLCFLDLVSRKCPDGAGTLLVYLEVFKSLGRPAPKMDERLEHILITGMFHTFFELIIHEMPLEDAEHYLEQMRDFYTAGWMKLMGQEP